MSFLKEVQDFEKSHPYSTYNIDGYTFRYQLRGPEESPWTLVYLVGGTGNPSAWYRHVLEMEKKFSVLLLDYPMGLDRMEPMVHLIAKFTEALGIKKAVWIGASLGGYVAQLLTKFYPEKTAAQVLYATSCLTEQGIEDLKKQYSVFKYIVWGLKHLPYGLIKLLVLKPSLSTLVPKNATAEEKQYVREFAQWTYDDYTKEKDLHMTGLQVDLKNVSPLKTQDFSYIGKNTLLVLPENDKAFSPDMQQELLNLIEGAKVSKVEGGHLATILHADKCTAVTEGFLSGIEN